MSPLDISENRIPFTELKGVAFGRKVIYTNAKVINVGNVADELSKALNIHEANVVAINYLDRYYRGDQPILYREKKIRPEINNKVVENHALEVVDSKVADLYGEPISYVLSENEDEQKAEWMKQLNRYMKSEDKAALDIERGRWASICGTSYFYIGEQNRMPKLFDEAPFYITCEHPALTFVVYFSDDKTPAYSVQIRQDENNEKFYRVWTNFEWFDIRNDEIIARGENGNNMIPVIEYPNNDRRLSDIEITIEITDAINNTQSDRQNAIAQFVQAFILFVNSEIDEETFKKLAFNGALSIKDAGDGRKADARMMTSELSQDGTQTSKDDLYNSLLTIQGMPSRNESSGSTTGQAEALRNGYYAEEKRAELRIPIYQKSERMMLRVVLNKLRLNSENKFQLSISDIDIRPKRSKLENMLVKAEVLQILHSIGVSDDVALETVNLFSDVQDVIMRSRDRMAQQFESGLSNTTEVIEDGNETEVVEDGNTTV